MSASCGQRDAMGSPPRRDDESAELYSAQIGAGIDKPSVGVPKRAVNDDFFQSTDVFKGMEGQIFYVVNADGAQAATVAEVVLTQFDEILRKLHLRQLLAAIEGPSCDDALFGNADAAEGRNLEGTNADGVHALGQDDGFEPAVSEGIVGKRKGAPLHSLPLIFIYIGLAARGECGTAEVETDEAAVGGELLSVVACHFAQESQVGAVDGALDGQVGKLVLLAFANQRGQCAWRLYAHAATFSVGRRCG